MKNADNPLIISHRKPDADTLGAALALKTVFGEWGKRAVVACIDKPSDEYNFLPGISSFVDSFDLSNHDLIIVVDSGASYMTDFHLKYEGLFKTGIPMINIDHHSSNDMFGTVNLVDDTAASTTVLLYRMFKYWDSEICSNSEICKELATCLLAGIYGDTGSFMHSNTSREVMEISADLMNLGASVAEISRSLYRNVGIEKMKLWGKVLEKAYVTDDKVVMSVIREEDYADMDDGPENLGGVVDYLNMVPDTKFAVLLNEDRRGNVKGSFRTRESNMDLSRIAAVFGGGGHPKASGFTVPGKLQEEVRYSIVSDDMSKKSLDF